MWKVNKIVSRQLITFHLSGRLEGKELTHLHDDPAMKVAEQPLVLDLREVKLVDRDAIRVLARCEMCGTELRNCPIYIRDWINRIESEATQINSEEFLRSW